MSCEYKLVVNACISDPLHLRVTDAFSPVISAGYGQPPQPTGGGSHLGGVQAGVDVGEEPGVAKDRLEAQTLSHLDSDALSQQILMWHRVENNIYKLDTGH